MEAGDFVEAGPYHAGVLEPAKPSRQFIDLVEGYGF
jgi:hypothetical protein